MNKIRHLRHHILLVFILGPLTFCNFRTNKFHLQSIRILRHENRIALAKAEKRSGNWVPCFAKPSKHRAVFSTNKITPTI